MRFIKAGIISIIVLSILMFLFSLLFPSQINISRAVNIYATRAELSKLILDPAGWSKWYDPLLGANKAGWELDGNTYKKDAITIEITALSDTSVAVHAHTLKDDQVSKVQIIGDGESGFCTVQWGATIQVKWYPWEKLSTMLFDQIIGGGMELSLDKLKALAEKP